MAKCNVCKSEFQKTNISHVCCSFKCAIFYASELEQKRKAKEWRIEKKQLKEKIKTHENYLKDLEAIFNAYIRKRDKDLPCVSCGKFTAQEFHAGHYIAKTYKILRFNENNVWKQCSRCNTRLRGNLIPYRIELVKRIGLVEVEKLENARYNEYKLTIPEIKEKIIYYKAKLKNE